MVKEHYCVHLGKYKHVLMYSVQCTLQKFTMTFLSLKNFCQLMTWMGLLNSLSDLMFLRASSWERVGETGGSRLGQDIHILVRKQNQLMLFLMAIKPTTAMMRVHTVFLHDVRIGTYIQSLDTWNRPTQSWENSDFSRKFGVFPGNHTNPSSVLLQILFQGVGLFGLHWSWAVLYLVDYWTILFAAWG